VPKCICPLDGICIFLHLFSSRTGLQRTNSPSCEYLLGEAAECFYEVLRIWIGMYDGCGEELEHLNGIAMYRKPVIAFVVQDPEEGVHHSQ